MTQGQQESLFMTYVSACNGFMYTDDLRKDKSLSPHVRQSVNIICSRFEWIKKAMELKTDSSVLKSIDTLRFDEILRLMASLEDHEQDELEELIRDFVKNIRK